MDVPTELSALLADRGLQVLGPAVGGGWRVRTGGQDELTALPVGRPAADLDVLAGLRHPHLAPVTQVLGAGASRCVLLLAPVPGTPLDRLVAGYGVLAEAEVATVGVPLAQAVGALHAVGLAHGGLTAAGVMVRPTGEPVLVDVAPRPGATPAADVRALLQLLLGLLAGAEVYAAAGLDDGSLRAGLQRLAAQPGTAPVQVEDLCRRTVRPEPLPPPRPAHAQPVDAEPAAAEPADGRPGLDAADLAARLVRSAARAPRHRGRAPGRPGRVVLALAGAAVCVAAVALPLGRAWLRPSPTAAVTASGAQPVDPADAASLLSRQRARLLAEPAGADLAQVEVVGGPAWSADTATLAGLAGVRLEGLAVQVADATTTQVGTDGSARVRLTCTQGGYVRVGPGDARVSVGPAPARTVELDLRRTSAGWRVWAVSGSSTP